MVNMLVLFSFSLFCVCAVVPFVWQYIALHANNHLSHHPHLSEYNESICYHTNPPFSPFNSTWKLLCCPVYFGIFDPFFFFCILSLPSPSFVYGHTVPYTMEKQQSIVILYLQHWVHTIMYHQKRKALAYIYTCHICWRRYPRSMEKEQATCVSFCIFLSSPSQGQWQFPLLCEL